MPWTWTFSSERKLEYISPSTLYLNQTDFKYRKFARMHGPAPLGYLDRHLWYDINILTHRNFEVLYGFNPRCYNTGSWGKPGFGYPRLYRRD
jgi:hypothetical protein